MTLDKLAELVDDRYRVVVTFALRATPCKQAVAAQHHTVAPRRLLDDLLQHHAKLKAGPLPGQPRQLEVKLFIELFHLDLPVGRSRQRDPPVRMQMVNMCKRQEAVQ